MERPCLENNHLSVDLNADLGEQDTGVDEQLLALVSSVNIACGWHAGSPLMMKKCVSWAVERSVAIGAHPSFPDRENFGRIEMHLPVNEIYSGVQYQIGALCAIAGAQGAKVVHVKPHGALYNMAARDAELASVIVSAIHDVDPTLVLFGLAGSELIAAAKRAGLNSVEEVFADRRYSADGSLVKRGIAGALIDDEDQSLAQTLTMIKEGKVCAIDGSWIPVKAGTICLHGDGVHALAFARRIRNELMQQGVTVRASIYR